MARLSARPTGPPERGADPRDTGSATRLGIGAQVLSSVLVALLVAGLATWLAEQPGFRPRVDLTSDEANTLAPAASTVLAALSEGEADVRVDVFFRPVEHPLTAAAGVAQERFFRLLVLAEAEAGGRLLVTNHDLSDPNALADIGARMNELGVREANSVTFSSGPRRASFRLLGEIAEFDLGAPGADGRRSAVPARISAFHGEEVLVTGVRRVTAAERRKIAFSNGQGERDLFGDEPGDLATLRRKLLDDGFELARWEPARDGAVPDDVDVVAVVGARDAFSPSARAALLDWVNRGGRLLVAPHPALDEADGGALDVLTDLGIVARPGFVAQPVFDAQGTLRMGLLRNTFVTVPTPQLLPHPITDALRREDRRLLFTGARAWLRGETPAAARYLALARSVETTWLDHPEGAEGKHDWGYDAAEPRGPFDLVIALSYSPPLPPREGARRIGGAEARLESRVAALPGADALSNDVLQDNAPNADLALNLLRWLASLDDRVTIAPRDRHQRRLALDDPHALPTVARAAQWWIPGGCAALGLLLHTLRRRSCRPRPSSS